MAETFLYLTLGTCDLSRATRFYDAALAPLGLIRRATETAEVGYGFPADRRARLWITLPFDGKPATVANGATVGFACASPEQVHAWHDAGVAAGGVSIEDPPGLRTSSLGSLYLAYVRDPDGNKLCALYRPR